MSIEKQTQTNKSSDCNTCKKAPGEHKLASLSDLKTIQCPQKSWWSLFSSEPPETSYQFYQKDFHYNKFILENFRNFTMGSVLGLGLYSFSKLLKLNVLVK